MHLETANDTRLVLMCVRHVEALHLNIISVGLLDGDDYFGSFGKGQYKLTKDNMIVARDKIVSVLYHVIVSSLQLLSI